MHRFMSLRKLHASNANFSCAQGEMQFTRTCVLCNRISSDTPFAGRIGTTRVHSTWLHPQHITFTINKKRRYKIGNVPPPQTNAGSSGKYKRKMRITILDAKEDSKESRNSQSFLISSPSSPAFVRPELMRIGVTIMIPPNPSKKMINQAFEFTRSSTEELSTTSTRKPSMQHTPPLSFSAAELILKGLSSNRFLVNNYSPIGESIQTNGRPVLKSHMDYLSEQMVTLDQPKSNLPKKCIEIVELAGKEPKESDLPLVETENRIVPVSKKDKEAQYSGKVLEIRTNITKQVRLSRRAAYIDVCMNSGRQKHAIHYASFGFKLFPDVPLRSILLEPLLSHAALEGNVTAVVHSLSLAESFNVSLSKASYIICFEMLGRLPESDSNCGLVRTLLENMKKDKMKFSDIITICQNRQVLIQRVCKAISSVDANHLLSDPSVPRSEPSSIKYPVDYIAECYHSPAHTVLSGERATKLVDEQIAAHSLNSYKVKNIACSLSDEEIEKLLQAQKKIENMWRESIATGFQRNLKALKKDKSFYQLSVFLEALPVEAYVDIVINEVHSRIEDSDKQSIGFVFAQQSLGKQAKKQYDLAILKKYNIFKDARKAHIEYCKWYSNPEDFPLGPSNPREIWERIVDSLHYNDTSSLFLLRDWLPEMYLRIGKFLYEILLKDVKIDENIGKENELPIMVPALYAVFRKTTKGYQKQLKVHPSVHHIFPNMMQPFLNMNPMDLPMLCPPRPWVSATNGVYPVLSPSLQRCPESRMGEEALAENIASVPTEQLYPILDSLNQLGSVPWKINNPVLNVVTEVFNSGGSKELSIPAPPSAALQEPLLPQSVSLPDRIKIGKERALVRQENAAMFSLWCDTLYKLSIAHEFRDRTFWLPHNMDFRGRVYPVCPHLQHMSNDVARSLLIFAKGEKLGPGGLDWLKIHTINLIGNMSKDSLQSRLAYANEILPKILDSAERPLTGERWWINSEYPWQTLSACMEIANALSSGDVENFISHFPVHQDGSCNGLQHYAALGRDSLGAKSVNLVNTDKPSDVYMCVAKSVEDQRANDAANGNALAQSLENFICRKLVKQTVMTTVYGVTQYGAQMQIRGQLKDLGFPQNQVALASSYIAKLVFQSLGEMFTSSRNTQDWLTQCANSIVKSKNMPVQWVTPLGLPVVQPYFKKFSAKRILKQLPDIDWINPSSHRLPTSLKHRNAFSPNFIHSLDSCHMILTGLHCEQSNITFVSVHDCYWVHAKNVGMMSKICREQFVALHSKPILEDLSKYMIETYCSRDDSSTIEGVEERRLYRLFSAVPPKGDFDLNEVLKSKYFFS